MKIRKSTVALWVLVLLEMIVMNGCDPPVTVETPVPTPDIAATVEAAVAVALTSQPTPDVAATVEAAVATEMAVTQTAQAESTATLTEVAKGPDAPVPIPTVTPTVTPTPTATPIPPPKPDAVVNTELLNLRSGPGTDYDSVRVLRQGNPLKVTGKNLAGDWLKVIAPGGEEGWVAAICLEINISPAGVAVAQAPPTPTQVYTPTPTETPTLELLPAPTLLEPRASEGDFTGSVVLRWQWEERPLEQDEFFSLRVYNEREGECHHTQMKEPVYVGGLSYCPSGEYYWRVAVVRRLCEECPNEQKWQTLSQPSEEEWLFRYQAVEPDQPWEPPEPPKEPPKKPPRP